MLGRAFQILKLMEWHHYNLYGLTLRSKIPFPELAAVEINKPASGSLVTFRQGILNFPRNGNGETFQGLTYCWSRDRQTVRVDSPLAGQFFVHLPSKNIAWQSRNGSSQELARVILRGKVLGLLLTHLPSFLVLHGNVLNVNGRNIALCGGLRQGKSTLSSWLLGNGALLHSDDTVALEFKRGTFWAHSGPPEIRLWPRSAFLLKRLRLPGERLYPETKKNRFLLNSLSNCFSKMPLRLQILYMMTRKRKGKIQIETLGPQERFAAILKNIYLPILQNSKCLLHQFVFITKLAETMAVRRLTFPSNLSRLDEVGNVLLNDSK